MADDLELVDGLVQLSFAVQHALAEAAGRHDVTVAQVRLLGILRDREPGMMQLAAHLGLDKSSVTGLVDRAERRGLVRRVPSPEDGRAVLVAPTALGRRLSVRVGSEITAALVELTADLGPAGRARLATLLTSVVAST